MKKKILFVINTLTIGGANTSLSALYAEMRDLYDIKVFALTHDGNKESHGFNEVLLSKDPIVDAFLGDFDNASRKDKPFRFIVKIFKRLCIKLQVNLEKYIFQRAVRKIEKQFSFDRVVAFQEEASALFASIFSCDDKLAWIHCDFTQGFATNDAEIYRYFRKIVFVSHYTEQQFLDKFPKYKGHTCFVYNFLDESRIQRLAQKTIFDMDLSDKRFTLLSLGRIVPLKRFSKIPEIVAEIKSRGIDVRWIILGPVFDEKEYSILMNDIIKYNVGDSVLWLGDKINPYPYMLHSDLCVSLSTTEACPMIFNEARVLNVPIVTTDFGSANEFVTNGIDGFVCPIADIADVISDVCLNIDLYKSIREKSGTRYIVNNTIRKQLLSILN